MYLNNYRTTCLLLKTTSQSLITKAHTPFPSTILKLHRIRTYTESTFNITSLYNSSKPLDPTDAKARAEQIYNEAYPDKRFRPYNSWSAISILKEWIAAGPPPLSTYKLTFGKHRGKTLDQVPDIYLVKYLIPRAQSLEIECPLIRHVVEDYVARNPGVKSQAGRKKAEDIEGRVVEEFFKKRKVGRPRKDAPPLPWKGGRSPVK